MQKTCLFLGMIAQSKSVCEGTPSHAHAADLVNRDMFPNLCDS